MTTEKYKRIFEMANKTNKIQYNKYFPRRPRRSREEKIEYLANDGFVVYTDDGETTITSVHDKKAYFGSMPDKELNSHYRYAVQWDNDGNPGAESYANKLKSKGTLEKLKNGELTFDDLRDQNVPQDVIEILQDQLAGN